MSLIEKSTIIEVDGISVAKKRRICDFLQGAVYCWCKNRKDEWFAARDLLGGDNFYWEGTPLLALYKKHVKLGTPDPVGAAAKDAGWMLKFVIEQDKRRFHTKKVTTPKFPIRMYQWDGDSDY